MIRYCRACHVLCWFALALPISVANAWQISGGSGDLNSESRALWVSSTADLIGDSQRRAELLQFCGEQKVELIWLQLLYDIDGGLENGEKPTCRIRQSEDFRQLLQEAHSASIKIHAFDGYAEFALAEYHPIPLAIVQSLIEFNESGDDQERFDGVHFDNNPETLVGWQSRKIRPQLITEFLLLNQKCKQLSGKQKGFQFGIDIPGRWHPAGDDGDKSFADFQFDGKSQSVLQHCLDSVDCAAISGFSDMGEGTDVLIQNGERILSLLGSRNRPRIFLGVQTADSPSTRVWLALGLPRNEFELAAKDEANELLWRSRYKGYRLRTYDDGDNVHVGLEIPEKQVFSAPEFQKVLRKIIDTFGIGNRAELEIKSMLENALEQLQKNPDFSDTKQVDLKIDGLKNDQRGLFARWITRPEFTFGDDNSDEFQKEIAAAEKAFSSYPAFGGMAIHSFESAGKLLKKTAAVQE